MRYIEHRKKWIDCTGCALSEGRHRVVLIRGPTGEACRLPVDVLFVGEAPGASENVLGKPFVGPAGKLLDRIIYQVEENVGSFRYALTNLVGCFPSEEKSTSNHAPPAYAIKACASRLCEIVAICKPKLIVCVGSLSEKWTSKTLGNNYEGEYRAIIHPAAILRMGVSQKGLAVQRCEVVIESAVVGLHRN